LRTAKANTTGGPNANASPVLTSILLSLALIAAACSDSNETTQPAVTAGGSHSCALTTDNTITCWGDNTEGQADPPTDK